MISYMVHIYDTYIYSSYKCVYILILKYSLSKHHGSAQFQSKNALRSCIFCYPAFKMQIPQCTMCSFALA